VVRYTGLFSEEFIVLALKSTPEVVKRPQNIKSDLHGLLHEFRISTSDERERKKKERKKEGGVAVS